MFEDAREVPEHRTECASIGHDCVLRNFNHPPIHRRARRKSGTTLAISTDKAELASPQSVPADTDLVEWYFEQQ